MDSFEFNKIIAAVIVTVLVVLGIGKITDYLFYVEKPQQSAYKVAMVSEESNDNSTSMEGKITSNNDIKLLLAMGDMLHGKKVFNKCSACHSIAKGGSNKIGPVLWGVLGKKSASVPGYKYSKALVAHEKKWTFEELNGFLTKPTKWIQGTKMAFAGLKNEKDRASVLLYINSKSDKPLELP